MLVRAILLLLISEDEVSEISIFSFSMLCCFLGEKGAEGWRLRSFDVLFCMYFLAFRYVLFYTRRQGWSFITNNISLYIHIECRIDILIVQCCLRLRFLFCGS